MTGRMLRMTNEMAEALRLPLHRDGHSLSFPVFGPATMPVRTEDTWYDWPADHALVSEVLKR